MLDRFNRVLGTASSWLTLIMVLVTFTIVVMHHPSRGVVKA